MRSEPDAPGWWRAIALGPLLMGALVVVLVLVATAVTSVRQEAVADAGTPTAALQAYLLACDEHDVDAAYAALSPDAQRHMRRDRFEETLAWWQGEGPRWVRVERVTLGVDEARIDVTIRWRDPGLLPGEDEHRQLVRLAKVDDHWRIADAVAGLARWADQ